MKLKRSQGGMMGPKNHWAEDVDFPVNDWADAARNGETRLSYWDWVERERGNHDA